MEPAQVDRAPTSRLVAAARVAFLTARSMLLLPVGFLVYALTGRTPQSGYQAFVWLFCVTRGRSNDWLSKLVCLLRPKFAFGSPAGVLGADLDRVGIAGLRAKLVTDGYVVFERALPNDMCDRLARFAHETESRVRASSDGGKSIDRILYDGGNLRGVRYDYAESVLVNNPDVQALLADPSLLSLAQEYLGCRPVADVVNMWWHTNFHDQPDAEAAQFFHFDMDRLKWLKVFIYLTDVGPDNGPHTFVRGSQRTGGIPSRLLMRGYKRLTDEEVLAHYPPSDCIRFTAPRGTIIVEDTRGLHKGANVRGDSRLILQLQFSNSLFGTNYPRARIQAVGAPSLRRMVELAPSIYSQYT